MGKHISLVGKIFGSLQVVERTTDKIRNYNGRDCITVQYRCECSCGVRVVRTSQYLKDKKYPSCSQKCRIKGTKNRYKIGDKIGKLTVVEGPMARKEMISWRCKCDCGGETFLNNSNARKRSIFTCQRCHSIETIKEYNSSNKIPHNKLPFGEAAFRGVYSRYKQNAKNRGLSFSLTPDVFRIITKQNCTYCGVAPFKKYPCETTVERAFTKLNKQVNGFYIYNGIDRMNPELGYDIKNCTPCCETCNYMKQSMTYEEFITHVRKIGSFMA